MSAHSPAVSWAITLFFFNYYATLVSFRQHGARHSPPCPSGHTFLMYIYLFCRLVGVMLGFVLFLSQSASIPRFAISLFFYVTFMRKKMRQCQRNVSFRSACKRKRRGPTPRNIESLTVPCPFLWGQ